MILLCTVCGLGSNQHLSADHVFVEPNTNCKICGQKRADHNGMIHDFKSDIQPNSPDYVRVYQRNDYNAVFTSRHDRCEADIQLKG